MTTLGQTLTTAELPGVNGWTDTSDVWTRTGNHEFTVPGNLTGTYGPGVKVRYKDTGNFEYGNVYQSAFGGSLTQVTLFPNTDFLMATGTTITNRSYSRSENPEGFPAWFNMSSPAVDASGALTWTTTTTVHSAFRVFGRNIEVSIFLIGTTGGTTSNKIYVGPPVAVVSPFGAAKLGVTQVRDGAAGSSVVGSGFIDNVNGITIYKADDSNWSLGASRVIFWNGIYPY